MKKVIIQFKENMDMTESEVDAGLDNIKKNYRVIRLMPEKTRRTKKVMDRLVKLKMLEGLLLRFKR